MLRNLIILCCFSFSVITCQAHQLNSKQTNFVNFLLPKVHQINQNIMQQRKHLLSLDKLKQNNKTLSPAQMAWLLRLAKQYGIKNPNFNSTTTWVSLANRVDVLPDALVVAQAVNESAWGRSRFAKLGNNYFGQWCFTAGCGIAPKKRPTGATYEVRKFIDPTQSVYSYIQNINTNPHYRYLRKLRAQMRKSNQPLNAMKLANGLVYYSTRREAYVRSIQSIISNYQIGAMAKAYQKSLQA